MLLPFIGILVQPPLFWTFFIGPVSVFVLDKLISLSRNKTEISIVKAELLPSGKTCISIAYLFKTGQSYKRRYYCKLDICVYNYDCGTETTASH